MTEPAEEQMTEPTEEQIAERAARANRATRGAFAATLCLESLTVLLIPRAIAQTDSALTPAKTWTLVTLSVVLFVGAFLLRRPWGIALGAALQLALVAASLLEPAFVIVAVIFVAVWGYIAHTRHELVGTPSGWQMFTR